MAECIVYRLLVSFHFEKDGCDDGHDAEGDGECDAEGINEVVREELSYVECVGR